MCVFIAGGDRKRRLFAYAQTVHVGSVGLVEVESVCRAGRGPYDQTQTQ